MATFVLCHGGFAGGWQWRQVADLLRANGHTVYTPTFTGLGERVHLAHPDVDLDTLITDVVNVIQYEELTDVTLVGYSFSGMVITGVADLIPERLSRLVYLDAYVPRDGESLIDLLGTALTTQLMAMAEGVGDGWKVPHIPNPDEDPDPRYIISAAQDRAATRQIKQSLRIVIAPHIYLLHRGKRSASAGTAHRRRRSSGEN